MRGRECFENPLSEPVKELVTGEVRRELAFVAVEKKKIDIRAVIQFAASEFTERKNGKCGARGAVALPEFGIPMFEHAANANFCDLRKLPGGFLKRGYVRKRSEEHTSELQSRGHL